MPSLATPTKKHAPAAAVVDALFPGDESAIPVSRLRDVLAAYDLSEDEVTDVVAALDADGDGLVRREDVEREAGPGADLACGAGAGACAEGLAASLRHISQRRISQRQLPASAAAGRTSCGANGASARTIRHDAERLKDEVSVLLQKGRCHEAAQATLQEQLLSTEARLFSTAQRAEEMERELAASQAELRDCKRLMREYAAKTEEAENEVARLEAEREAVLRASEEAIADASADVAREVSTALAAERAVAEQAVVTIARVLSAARGCLDPAAPAPEEPRTPGGPGSGAGPCWSPGPAAAAEEEPRMGADGRLIVEWYRALVRRGHRERSYCCPAPDGVEGVGAGDLSDLSMALGCLMASFRSQAPAAESPRPPQALRRMRALWEIAGSSTAAFIASVRSSDIDAGLPA
eukprot:tig00020878_g14867.t1